MKSQRLLRLYALALAVLLTGVFSCSSSSKTTKDEETARGAATENATDEEPSDAKPANDSELLPIGSSPVLGPADAPVTIVEFADYQCPFCAKSHETMLQIRAQYGDDVRVVFKHYPLPFHQQAEPASRAAIAAGEQGKFWEMHDLLFRYQRVMKGKSDEQMKEWSAGFAEEMGLDVEQFKQDFDAESTQQQIEEDLKLTEKLGIKGTPHYVINGVRIRGAQPINKFETVIEAELEAAEDAGDVDNFYAMRVEENYEKPAPPKPSPKPSAAKKSDVAYVPVDADDPMTGETDDPLVTMVVFSDFQCPFCSKAVPTIEQVEKEYGDKVRIVFKQLPLPFHKQAEMAAEIALAAQEQGKFWEMHDLLFERQREMRSKSDAEMVQWSRELAEVIGADPDKLAQQVDKRAHKQEINDESKLAGEVGARGTPNFFINGQKLTGAQPYPRFKTVIDEQLEIAETLSKDKGLEGDALYKAAVEFNEENAPEPPARPGKPDPQVDTSDLTIDDDQVKNAQNYDVTVFAFADYQCPYCNRGHDNLHAAIDQVDAKVRVIFKHFPLPFHKQAKDAAYAAMAAGEQGKFWEMSDKLFAQQKRLREDGVYVEWAGELGLDVEQFKKDMKNNKKAYEDQIKEDMAQGQKIGVRGTPAYFVDGHRIVGAQPTQEFVDVIKEKAKESEK